MSMAVESVSGVEIDSTGFRRLGWGWLWVVVPALLAIVLSTPMAPAIAFGADLDTSFRICYDYSFLHGFRLGKDMLGTYGPWGFACEYFYWPGTYGWAIAVRTVISLGFIAGIWGIGRGLKLHPLICGLWMVVAVIWGDLSAADGMICVMWMFPSLIRRLSPQARDSWPTTIVVWALALAGLCKFTFLVVGAMSVVLLGVEDLIRRRWPRQTGWFVIATLLFWRLGGQPFQYLPAYLHDAWNMAAGYSAAMGHPSEDFFMLPVFIGISAAICGALLVKFWEQDRTGALVLSGTTALILFFCMKEGFVRHDGHEGGATTGLVVATVVVCPVLALVRSRRWLGLMGGVLVIASICCVCQTYRRFFRPKHLSTDLYSEIDVVKSRVLFFGGWVWQGDQVFEKNYDAGIAAIRAEYPIPHLAGKVDMYGLNQLAILASKMDYIPRPLVPGYHAWTPHLIDINWHSLTEDRAPDNIFFALDPIDARFPAIDDAVMWPGLLTRYDVVGMAAGKFAILHRNNDRRSCSLTPISSSVHHFGENIELPSTDGDPVWVQIKLVPRITERLRTTLLRSNEVNIRVEGPELSKRFRRIIPAMAEVGFVISPYIDDAAGFVAMAAQKGISPEVKQFAVEVQQTNRPGLWFDSDIQITFKRLRFERQNLLKTPELQAAINLWRMRWNNSAFLIEARPCMGPDGKAALFSHPPAHMRLDTNAGMTKLHFGFGVQAEAWDKTNGVLYRVSGIRADGTAAEIWSKQLLPRTRVQDRGEFFTDISIPSRDFSQLLFETLPVVDLNYDWAYWSDVRFE